MTNPMIATGVLGLALVLHGSNAPAQDGQQKPPEVVPPARVPDSSAGRGERCPQEAGRRSQVSTTSTAIQFVNNTTGAIRTYWLDFQGQRKFYAELQPGQSVRQQTYLTHPWVITDGGDNCLRFLMPAPRPITASVP